MQVEDIHQGWIYYFAPGGHTIRALVNYIYSPEDDGDAALDITEVCTCDPWDCVPEQAMLKQFAESAIYGHKFDEKEGVLVQDEHETRGTYEIPFPDGLKRIHIAFDSEMKELDEKRYEAKQVWINLSKELWKKGLKIAQAMAVGDLNER